MSGNYTPLITLFFVFIFVVRNLTAKGNSMFGNLLRIIFGMRAPKQGRGFKETKFTESLSDTDLQKMPERMREGIIALDNAKLPPYVAERIATQREGNLPWTSAASVNDWLLLRSLDLQPLGLVRGCSYYQIGFSIQNHIARIDKGSSYSYGSCSQELPEYGEVIRKACHLAFERLRDEAKLHGANAVVGVKLIPKMPDENDKIVEFEATGTAVKLKDQGDAPEQPVLCTTSVTDFAKLLQAGSMPVGIALGVGVYYAQTNLSTLANNYNANGYNQNFGNNNQSFNVSVGGFQIGNRLIGNQEIPSYSNAIYHVRNIALRHMEEDVRRIGGSGVLGGFTDFSVEEFEHPQYGDEETLEHILKFICLGTVLGTVNQYMRPKVKSIMVLNKKNNNVKLNRRVNNYGR
jgi:uncharacterized protein YbjQ (UPF0145 family)